MCGKGSSQSTSSVSPPESVKNAYNGVITTAQGTAATPYTPYSGQRVADFTGDQTQAFQNIRNNQGIGTPYLQQAAQYAQQGAAAITPDQIASYMNPYTQQVVDATQNDFNVSNQQQIANVNSNAAKLGALTGDRSQVANTLMQESQNRTQNPVIAGLRQQSFNTALGAAQADRSAAAQGAYAMGNLGQEAQNLSSQDVQQLLASGGLQQQLDQAKLNVPYQDYLTAQAYPFQTTQWLAGILGSIGPNMGSTSTYQPAEPSIWSQLAGLGAAGAGAYMASDERIKENIMPVGTMFDGTPIYRYNIAGQPKTEIGVLAQDVEQTNPAAVAERPDGLKMVDYDVATRPAVKASPGGLGQPFDPNAPPEPLDLRTPDMVARDQAQDAARTDHVRRMKDIHNGLSAFGEMLGIPRSGDDIYKGYADGGSVDPDFAKMTEHLAHATKRIREAMPEVPKMADGGSIGAPVPFQVGALPSTQVQPASFVPAAQMAGGHMMQAQTPQTQGSGLGSPSDLSAIGRGIGSYLGKAPASTVDPGTAMNGGWTTTTTPAAPGFFSSIGSMFGFAEGGPVRQPAAAGGAYLNPMMATPKGDDDVPVGPQVSTKGFNAIVAPTPFDVSTPGISVAGLDPTQTDAPSGSTPFSNDVKPDRIVPDAPLPPTATDYSAPDMPTADTAPVTTGSTDTAAAPQGRDTGKAWYEYGSNPNLGTALMAAGFGMMGGESPYAGVNIGRGALTGLNAYLQQKSAEREYDIKQREIERQAQILGLQMQKQAEVERYNRSREEHMEREDAARDKANDLREKQNSPEALEDRARTKDRIGVEEKARGDALAKAKEADEMARKIEGVNDLIFNPDGTPKIDPTTIGPVASSSLNNSLVRTLPQGVTNFTGAVSDILTGNKSGTTPTQRMRDRQVLDSQLQMVNAAITQAQNKGQGSVSDVEREMYAKVINQIMSGDLEGAKMQLGELVNAFRKTAEAARAPYVDKDGNIIGATEKKAMGGPVAGQHIEDGYRYIGGDLGSPTSWEKV